MGLFSKKTIICDECKKEYESRFTWGAHICTECAAKFEKKVDNILGYQMYALDVFENECPEQQWDAIIKHRDNIIIKHKVHGEHTVQNLTKVLVRKACGIGFTDNFLTLTNYPKTVVDMKDVFAIGYVTDYKNTTVGKEAIVCAIFTNDPYIPVLPMFYSGKINLMALTKSKKGREELVEFFELMCPNLTYPVQDLSVLQKTIKQSGEVKGNISKNMMLELIGQATVGMSIFNVNNMTNILSEDTIEMLKEHGYIVEGY